MIEKTLLVISDSWSAASSAVRVQRSVRFVRCQGHRSRSQIRWRGRPTGRWPSPAHPPASVWPSTSSTHGNIPNILMMLNTCGFICTSLLYWLLNADSHLRRQDWLPTDAFHFPSPPAIFFLHHRRRRHTFTLSKRKKKPKYSQPFLSPTRAMLHGYIISILFIYFMEMFLKSLCVQFLMSFFFKAYSVS